MEYDYFLHNIMHILYHQNWPDIFQHYYHISNKYYITKILFQYESKHIINSMNTHELISI